MVDNNILVTVLIHLVAAWTSRLEREISLLAPILGEENYLQGPKLAGLRDLDMDMGFAQTELEELVNKSSANYNA